MWMSYAIKMEKKPQTACLLLQYGIFIWTVISASPWYNCTGWLGVKHQLTSNFSKNRLSTLFWYMTACFVLVQGFRTIEDLRSKANLTHQQKVGVRLYEDLLDRMPREEAAEIEAVVSCRSLSALVLLWNPLWCLPFPGGWEWGRDALRGCI